MPKYSAIINADCRSGGKNVKRGDKFTWDSTNVNDVKELKSLVAAGRLILPEDLPPIIEPGSEYDGLRTPDPEPPKKK